MNVSFHDVTNSSEIRTYITQADASLLAMGYTEHSFAHVGKCAQVAAHILPDLGYSPREVELAVRGDAVFLLNYTDHVVEVSCAVPCVDGLSGKAFDGVIPMEAYGVTVLSLRALGCGEQIR